MMVGWVGRSLRAQAGTAALVAALVVVLCALVTGGRAWLATSVTTAFHQGWESAPRQATAVALRFNGQVKPRSASHTFGQHLAHELDPEIRQVVGPPRVSAWSPALDVTLLPVGDSFQRVITVAGLPHEGELVRWTSGRAPHRGPHVQRLPPAVARGFGAKTAPVVEIGLSRKSAHAVRMKPGSFTTGRRSFYQHDNPKQQTLLKVTGLYEPRPDAFRLSDVGGLRVPTVTRQGRQIESTALAADPGTVLRVPWFQAATSQWIFPGTGHTEGVDPQELGHAVAHLSAGAASKLTSGPGVRVEVVTGLGDLIDGFLHDRGLSNAAITLPATAVLACALLALALAATVLARRRARATALLRARGAGPAHLVWLRGGEALVLAGPGLLAGLGAAAAVRAGPPTGADMATAVLSAAVGAAVVTAVGTVPPPAARAGLSRRRRALRVAVEALVVVLAAVGVGVLAGRGHVQAGDPFLTLAPVLVALAATLLATKGLPRLLGHLEGVASSGRRLAPLVAASEALHAARVSVLPALVVVLAASTAVLSLAVTATVARGVHRAAWEQVGADVAVHADGLGPRIRHRVAALPGVTQVAAARVDSVPVDHAAGLDVLTVVSANWQTLQRVRRDAPAHLDLARSESAGHRQVAAIASPGIHPAGGPVLLHTDNGDVRLHIIGRTDQVPGLTGNASFVLVPRQALTRATSTRQDANVLLIRGNPASGALHRALGGRAATATITRRGHVAHQLTDAPMTTRTASAFWASTAVAGVLALAGIALAATTGAARRRRTIAVLRTLGAEDRHTCWAAPAQLLPVVLLAPAVGALVGYGLCHLFDPALDLGAFAGNPSVLHLSPDPTQAGLVAAGTLILATIALTAATLTALHRPLRSPSRPDTPEEP